jgi:phosphatidylglycerophosphatase A
LRIARHGARKDPQWVVIDEVSGQLITYYLFFPGNAAQLEKLAAGIYTFPVV